MRIDLALFTCLLAILPATQDLRAQGVVWAERMGSQSGDAGHSIAVDRDGNAYVTGSFQETAELGSYTLASAGEQDIFVAKFDRGGVVEWARRMGAEFLDRGYGIAVDGAGNAYVTGTFRGTVDFGAHSLTSSDGGYDIFVAKLDGSGIVLWARRMGGEIYYNSDYGHAIAVDDSGNAHVTGYFAGTADFGSHSLTPAGVNPNVPDIFVTKLDSGGTVQWARRMGGAFIDYGLGIAVEDRGNAYVTGYFGGVADFGAYSLEAEDRKDIFVAKLDAGGVVLWARRMGGESHSEYGDGIAVDGDGNAFVTGQFDGTADFGSYSLTSMGRAEIFVAKLDAAGTVQWARRIGGEFDDYGHGIAADGSGNAYVTGGVHGTVSVGAHLLTSAGALDIFAAKLDAHGVVHWATRMGSTVPDKGYSIAVDGGGNTYVTGIFRGTADFGSYDLASAGEKDIFVFRLRECGYFVDRRTYGRLLFPQICTRDASNLTQDVYASTPIGIHSGADDGFYLSSEGMRFAPLAVDDAVRCDGQTVGLGPYEYQPGVPPFFVNVPIEINLVPLSAHRIPGDLLAEGVSDVIFELVDTDRVIYGSTSVYLVRDCGIYLDKGESTTLHWVSYNVEIGGYTPGLDVVSGVLSELLEDRDFSRSCFLGAFVDTTQVIDSRPDPAVGQGYYYLVSGTCAEPIGYGSSSPDPDPRDTLPPGPICP